MYRSMEKQRGDDAEENWKNASEIPATVEARSSSVKSVVDESMHAQLVQDAASSMKAPFHRAYNPKESLSEGSSSAKAVEVPPMGHSWTRQVDGDFEHSACRHELIWQDDVATMVDSVSLDHWWNLQQRKTQKCLVQERADGSFRGSRSDDQCSMSR